MSSEWISTKELEVRLRVSRRSLERWKELHPARTVIGHTVFYDYPAVLEIMTARRGLSLGASRARGTVSRVGRKRTNKGKVRQ